MRTLGLLLTLSGLVSAQTSATMGVPFSLEVGDTAHVDGSDVSVTFVAVTNDSRCPRDVHCIVAGEAVIVFEVLVGESATELTFELPPGGSDEQELDGLEVAILALTPQAESTRKLRDADYVASVRIGE